MTSCGWLYTTRRMGSGFLFPSILMEARKGKGKGAAQRGATLTFAFSIPDVDIQKLSDVTLTASLNDKALNSAQYKAGGANVFTADVPPAALTTESVKIDFALDKSLPPGVDKRELGIIATSVGLAGK